ncbi:hypothetical protein EJ08DRAFT_693219 [Tothia fuscella]|uniref:RING-type domain-containing protein n=1 Tax=Tothia fuscella TaxID=1048955 RepID=A0A9P4NZX1_9PEZI|nr:hypothetical protein EJ08DRAFT_693219 [Tothia fuscella]
MSAGYPTREQFLSSLRPCPVDSVPENQNPCCICQENFGRACTPTKLPCGHYIGIGCVRRWVGTVDDYGVYKNKCPFKCQLFRRTDAGVPGRIEGYAGSPLEVGQGGGGGRYGSSGGYGGGRAGGGGGGRFVGRGNAPVQEYGTGGGGSGGRFTGRGNASVQEYGTGGGYVTSAYNVGDRGGSSGGRYQPSSSSYDSGYDEHLDAMRTRPGESLESALERARVYQEKIEREADGFREQIARSEAGESQRGGSRGGNGGGRGQCQQAPQRQQRLNSNPGRFEPQTPDYGSSGPNSYGGGPSSSYGGAPSSNYGSVSSNPRYNSGGPSSNPSRSYASPATPAAPQRGNSTYRIPPAVPRRTVPQQAPAQSPGPSDGGGGGFGGGGGSSGGGGMGGFRGGGGGGGRGTHNSPSGRYTGPSRVTGFGDIGGLAQDQEGLSQGGGGFPGGDMGEGGGHDHGGGEEQEAPRDNFGSRGYSLGGRGGSRGSNRYNRGHFAGGYNGGGGY